MTATGSGLTSRAPARLMLLRAAARRQPPRPQRTFVVAARKRPQQARAYSSPKPPHLTSKTLPRGRIGFVNGIRQLQKSLLNGFDQRPTLSELLPPDASITDVDKEEIKNLPRFDAAEDAEVLLCASETGFDLGVKRLRKALEQGDSSLTLHGKELQCLGFDTERPPTFRKGFEQNSVSVLQLASHDLVVLFLLKNMRHIPASLQNLLEDPSVLKVGVALSEDTNALSRHAPGLTVRGLVDLAPLAEARFPSLTRRGLRGLVASLGGRRLSKHQSTASWGQRTYTPAMIRYAANDALAGLFCFARILGHDREEDVRKAA